MNRKNFFLENGYYIEKNVYSKIEMNEMFVLFYDVFSCLSKKFNVKETIDYKKSSDVNIDDNLKELDHLMLDCFNHDKDIIGEGYDIIAYSSVFLRFFSNSKIESITKELLEIDESTSLYGWTNRVRIDPPADERRTYGWHQEVFYTIPESRYLQTWCPVIRDTTKDNGTIWVAPKSHKEGIAKQEWKEINGRATQIIVDEDIIKKYNPIQLEMKIGDVLFFDGKLCHRSGSNITKDEIRFSLVGMWHDIWTKNFRGPKPGFGHRTNYDQKEYWNKINKSENWGY